MFVSIFVSYKKLCGKHHLTQIHFVLILELVYTLQVSNDKLTKFFRILAANHDDNDDDSNDNYIDGHNVEVSIN